MKRLIVLLIVVAGGLAAAAFAVPTNAATVNGVAISQDQVNSDLAAIAASSGDLYGCYLSAEEAVGTAGATAGPPPVDGVGQVTAGASHATATAAFAASYVDTAIGHELLLQVAAARHVVVTPAEVSAARTQLARHITGIMQDVAGSKFACGPSSATLTGSSVLATMPADFVNRIARFDATVTVLEEDLSGYGASTAGQQRYFDSHRAVFNRVCFSVAGYSTQSAASTAATSVAGGTPFAQAAAAAGGGPQGCIILYQLATELPAGNNLTSLPLNSVSKPIASNGGYFLFEYTSESPSSFTAVKSEVGLAEQSAGAGATRAALSAAEKRGAISVDSRYGTWQPAAAQVLPPTTPVPGEVLDPAVDSEAAALPPSSGQTP